jgi:hypothetical protein
MAVSDDELAKLSPEELKRGSRLLHLVVKVFHLLEKGEGLPGHEIVEVLDLAHHLAKMHQEALEKK